MLSRKLPNFRSSRFYVPIVVNPVMTSNYVGVDKNDPHIVVDNPQEIRNDYNYYRVDASGHIAGYEPYRAFQKDKSGLGWRCNIVNGETPWISLSPGRNWRIPHENEKFIITKVEVVSREERKEICTRFLFQAKDEGLGWETLRSCKVEKPIENKTYVFQVELPEGRTTGYDEYRIVCQNANGAEITGFRCINMYYFIDHDELTFEYVDAKGRRFPRYIEKLFVQNDDTDGVVWEKLHDNTVIIANTDWYPGFYASRSYATNIIHPNDTLYVEEPVKGGGTVKKAYSNGPFTVTQNKIGGYNYIFRTKNYAVSRIGSYYYDSYNRYQYTRDGKHWTKVFQDKIPVAFFMGNPGGAYGTKDDNILVLTDGKAYRLELTGDDVKVVDLGPSPGGTYVGDIALVGRYRGPRNIEYFVAMDSEGRTYNTNLQAQYQYTDQRESDPAKQVITTDVSWKFFYADGTYYAAAKSIDIIFWNSVQSRWEQVDYFTCVKSTDGFRSTTIVTELDPCPQFRYSNFWFVYHKATGSSDDIHMNPGAELIEIRRGLNEQMQITNDTFTYINGLPAPLYVDVPLIGFNSDPLYDYVRVRYSNTVDNGGNARIRLMDFNPTARMAYIKNGKPATPEHYVIPTAFKVNWWGSGACDEGGYVVFGKDNFAFGTSSYMIDKHNYTYRNIIN